MANILRVGIIGASAERGWAKESHVPAIQQLPGLQLTAVATNDQETANAAARAFGAKAAYGNAQDLIRDADVDLVTVAVKVPDHRELILSALRAGKHVYCEWTLGRNSTESQELAKAAHKAGVHTTIGLQARMSSAAKHAQELLASGAIGRSLSARLYSSTVAFAPKIGKADTYLEKPENGATLVSIHGGHALDLAQMILGLLNELTALTTIQYPDIEVDDAGAKQTRILSDQLLVQARCNGSMALSIEVAGGRPPEASHFRLEITGQRGDLVLEGGAPRGFQSGRLRLTHNGKPVPSDEENTASMPDTVANVALMYAALRNDVDRNTLTVPDFDHAVRLQQLLDDVLLSAETGTRRAIDNSAH